MSAYKKRKSWLTSGLKKSIMIKNKLYVKFLKHPTMENKSLYKQYKCQLRSLLQKCERDHYNFLLIQNKNNMRKSWGIIKEVLNKGKKQELPDMFCIDDKKVEDKHIIANRFNKFYVNIGPSLAKVIPNSEKDPDSYFDNPNMNSIYFSNTDNTEVSNIIKMLKNSSPGWDNVSMHVIKKSHSHFLLPLVHVLNLSLTQGIVPNELKIARVIPIFKSGDKLLINNYRPVSVLPSFTKILEKLVYKRINDFITKYDILYKYQFGFRENHGTNLALSFLIDKIIAAHEKSQCVLGIFIDFSKAFDTINHEILFKKLENYGIRGNALNWTKHYFTNRFQFVQYKDVTSSHEKITCRVSQGSILGPLYFLLYFNDIVNASGQVLSILFADDTNLFLAGNNIDDMICTMNEELNNVIKWLHASKLSLNVKKTHYVIFKPGRSTVIPSSNIMINSTIIQ